MDEINSLKNWRRAVDPASGKVYYYNKITRETCWDAPVNNNDEIFMRGWYGSLASKDEEVMDVREAKDPNTGRTYYYDRKTRKTYWHDPRVPRNDELDQDEEDIFEDEESEDEDEKQYSDDEEVHRYSKDYGSKIYDEIDREILIHSNEDDDYSSDEFSGNLLDKEDKNTPIIENHSSTQMSSESDSSIENVSIDAVRSSLRLLKKNISSKKKSAWTNENVAVKKDDFEPMKHSKHDQPIAMNSTRCTRMSGCQCDACAIGVDQLSTDKIPCKFCKMLCFASDLQNHEKSCKMATPEPRRNFAIKTSTKKTPVTSTAKKTSWRSKSMQLRNAIGSNTVKSTGKLMNTGRSSNTAESDELLAVDGLVPCPNCHRTFNAKAAERHIPKCKDIVAKPTTLLRGHGKGAYVSAKKIENMSDSMDKKKMEKSNVLQPKKIHSNQNRVSVTEKGVVLTQCPHCDRSFGKKALERHIEYCTSKSQTKTNSRKSSSFKRENKKDLTSSSELDTLYQKLSMAYDMQPFASNEDNFEDSYFHDQLARHYHQDENYYRTSQGV